MSLDAITQIFVSMMEIYSRQIPIMLALAALFTGLAVFKNQASSPGKVWWRNPGLVTDLTYSLIHAGVSQYFKWPVLIFIYAAMTQMMTPEAVKDYFVNGRGPLSGLAFEWQVAIYVIGSDFLLYWIHRAFHEAALWRFHAIHHSATEVDWTTTYRFHPVNLILQPTLVGIVMVSLGIKPQVVAFMLPFDIVSAAFVHANVNWTLGPLKYIVATPVFHRWHHTMPNEGGNSNFAPTFAIWDLLFGTFYMPEGKLPQVFGNDDHAFPEGYFTQLMYPFKKAPAAPQPPPILAPAE